MQKEGPKSASTAVEMGELIRTEYERVQSYLEQLGVPSYDTENGRGVNSTPIMNVTDLLRSFSKDSLKNANNVYLKEEYSNPLTRSVKGRAVAAMVLGAIKTGSMFACDDGEKKKRWIEPTSGNTGKGLAEIAKLLGVEFTSVFSRLDVSKEIKAYHAQFGARILTIGAEYSLAEIEALAKRRHKRVVYYWIKLDCAVENNL